MSPSSGAILNKVVALGAPDDEDISLLQAAGSAAGVDVIAIPVEQVAPPQLLWRWPMTPRLVLDDIVLDESLLADATAILYKRARMDDRPRIREGAWEADDGPFAQREWRTAIDCAVACLLDGASAPVVGHPRELLLNDWKPYLLTVAATMGARVPPSCITTDISAWDTSPTVAKAINANPNIDAGRYFPTSPISTADLTDLSRTTADVPMLLQQQVERQYEIRVLAMRNRLFPRRLDVDESIVDIKYAAGVRRSPCAPPHHAEVLSRLMTWAGLTYCCFDILVDTNNQEWLVDITPRGSWYLADDETMTLTTEILLWLAGGCS